MSIFKKIFSKNKRTSSLHTNDQIINILYAKLSSKLKAFDVHFELKSKLKIFEKLDQSKQKREFPGIYLEIEDFLLLQKHFHGQTKSSFRAQTLEEYPQIKEYHGLYVIFLSSNLQRLSLSRMFLKDSLNNAKNLTGNFNNTFLKEAENNLKEPFELDEKSDKYTITAKLKELHSYSEKLQQKLEESLGSNAMLSLYNKTYNKHFNNYYLLTEFTTIINLVPEELLITENVNLPSKGQMHRLLKSQITTLEEINTRLSKEVQERKQVQKELEINERLYSAVLHNALHANIIIDQDGNIVRWNAKAEKMFTGGKNLFSLLPSKISKDLKQKINSTSIKELQNITNDSFIFDIIINEETSFYNLKTSPVFVDNAILFFCVIQDVSKEKKSIEEIETAKDIAIKSSKAKSTFLSNMSHEIRTPLNVILGLSDLFTKDSFEGSSQEFENIEVIKFSAENLLTLVNDILDFSKIEAGKMIAQKVDFNFYEVIENITKGFSLKAKEKGIIYETIICKNAPKFIIGDQFRLSQILNNLLSNAIKFTRDGNVSLRIKLVEKNNLSTTIKFEIIDTGIGISATQKENIFESFYQTTGVKDKKPNGTGLGLSITKQLVTILGGALHLESLENKGSTFSFEIPFGISEFTENAIVPSSDTFEKRILKDKHILVAEDNKLNQMFINQLLTKWHAKITIANNGAEALELIQKEKFDLILMDVHMPILNGLEATKAIRAIKDELLNKIPIVACSADVFPESRKLAQEAGVDFYITKPINKDSIREILFLLTQ